MPRLLAYISSVQGQSYKFTTLKILQMSSSLLLHLLLSVIFAFLWSERRDHTQNHIVSCLTISRDTNGDIIHFDAASQPQSFQCSDINGYNSGKDCKCYWKGTYYTSNIGDTKCYQYQYNDTNNNGCKTSTMGTEYRGSISRTKSGRICQAWTSQTPHTHTRTPSDYPDAGLENNYCRNPDNEPLGPWCYTMDRNRKWEFCLVPLCPGCNYTYTNPSGVLTSHNYSRHRVYPNDNYCTYLLKYPSQIQLKIKINFERFKLEWSSDCVSDYLSIYDGETTSAPLIGKYCGDKSGTTITSTGNALFLIFRTDYGGVDSGFKLTFKRVDCNQIYTGQSGVLISRNYPQNYPNNHDCTYLLKYPAKPLLKVKISFTNFNLESSRNCKYDYLSIYDGETASARRIGKYCGSRPPSTNSAIISTGNALFLKFKTDRGVVDSGFRLTYTRDCALEFVSLLPQYVKTLDLCNGFNKSIGRLSNCQSPAITDVKYWKNVDIWESISGPFEIELQGTDLEWKLTNASNLPPYYYGLLLKIGLTCEVNSIRRNQCILLKIKGTRSYPTSYTSVISACIFGTSSTVSNPNFTARTSEVVSFTVPITASLTATSSLSIIISKAILVSQSSLQQIEKTSVSTMSSLVATDYPSIVTTPVMIIPTSSLTSIQKVSPSSVIPIPKKEPGKGGKNAQKKKDNTNVAAIAGAGTSVIVIAIIVAVAVFVYWKRRLKKGQNNTGKKWRLKKKKTSAGDTNRELSQHSNPVYGGVTTSVHRNPVTGDLHLSNPFGAERMSIDRKQDNSYDNTMCDSIVENESQYAEVDAVQDSNVRMQNQSSKRMSSLVKADGLQLEDPLNEDNCTYAEISSINKNTAKADNQNNAVISLHNAKPTADERESENPYYGGIMTLDKGDGIEYESSNPIYEGDCAYAEVDGINRNTVKIDYPKYDSVISSDNCNPNEIDRDSDNPLYGESI